MFCAVVTICRVNVESSVPLSSVLCPLFFLMYTAELFTILENYLYSYADDSTLVAVVISPGERVCVQISELQNP